MCGLQIPVSGGFDVAMQLSDNSIVHVVLHPGDNWSFDHCDDGSPFAAKPTKEEHFAALSDEVTETRKEAQARAEPMAAAFALVVRFDASIDGELRVTVWVRLGGGAQRTLARVQLPSAKTNDVAVKFQENEPAAYASSGRLRLLVRGQECMEVGVQICAYILYLLFLYIYRYYHFILTAKIEKYTFITCCIAQDTQRVRSQAQLPTNLFVYLICPYVDTMRHATWLGYAVAPRLVVARVATGGRSCSGTRLADQRSGESPGAGVEQADWAGGGARR